MEQQGVFSWCFLVSLHLEKQPGCVWQSFKAPSLMTHFRRTALVSNNFALCCDFRGCELKKKERKNKRNQLSPTQNGGHMAAGSALCCKPGEGHAAAHVPWGRPTHAEMEVPAAKARLAPYMLSKRWLGFQCDCKDGLLPLTCYMTHPGDLIQ